MSNVKFEKLKDFGVIHRTPKRIIVASLQKSTAEENGEEKDNIYISFHEHYMNDEGKLLPRSSKNQNSKWPEKIISFTLHWDEETVGELVSVAKSISKFFDEKPKPAKERF